MSRRRYEDVYNVRCVFQTDCLCVQFRRSFLYVFPDWNYQLMFFRHILIWACAWQNQQNNVQPVKIQISLGIRPVLSVFAVHMKKAWVLNYLWSAQRRLWSDWADAGWGWSESSLSTQVFLLVLPCVGSYSYSICTEIRIIWAVSPTEIS